MTTILVTGGTGFIGSHIAVELLSQHFNVVIVDNLSNSSIKVLDRIRMVAFPDKQAHPERLAFHQVDLLDQEKLDKVFVEHPNISSVIHLAGYKAVGESVKLPFKYFHNNVTGSLILFEVMKKHNVKKLIFSSTATVYGEPEQMPIKESFPLDPKSPYARTKFFIEEILRDEFRADPTWHIGILRYFNPIGAHSTGLLGEDPNGIPNNLMPYISKIAAGKLTELSVYGNDYPTRDGTGIRDYLHVVDLAEGHISALKKLDQKPDCFAYNLGTGNGQTVLEVVSAFEKACGKKIPYKIVGRRAGDVPELRADPAVANAALGWTASRSIAQMCADSWNWQSKNPDGYNTQL